MLDPDEITTRAISEIAPPLDHLGRPVVSDAIRQQIDQAFTGVEGRGALLILADEHGTRAHLAAKLGDGWKVAAGAGFVWADQKPSGWVGIMKTW